jgi:putative phosphoribosyl transferase
MTDITALDAVHAPLFADRWEGGRSLADALAGHELGDAVVVGLARGGVVPAAAIAEQLGLPLDILAVRKVGHPAEPEFAIGAVTPGGGRVVSAGEELPDEVVAAAVAAAERQAVDLDRRLHAEHAALDLKGKTVVLADDGLATGATMTAAVRWARLEGAGRIIVAVPIGPAETVARLEQEADEVVCPVRPALFGAVGFWYEQFAPTADEDVLALLAAAHRRGRDAADEEQAVAAEGGSR